MLVWSGYKQDSFFYFLWYYIFLMFIINLKVQIYIHLLVYEYIIFYIFNWFKNNILLSIIYKIYK